MRKVTSIIVALVIIAIPIVAMFAWMSSRPSWQISARNLPQGVVIDVYKSNANQPSYTTVLTGQTINTEVERVTRLELPEEIGETTFHDETLRPGRWTVVLNKTEINIRERALIVDRSTEIVPQDCAQQRHRTKPCTQSTRKHGLAVVAFRLVPGDGRRSAARRNAVTRAKVSYTTDHKEILDGILLAITGVTAGKRFGFPAYFIGKKFVRLRLWRWRRGKIADRAGR